MHYYFIHKNCNFLNFRKTVGYRLNIILLQLLIDLLVNTLLSRMPILLMRLTNWDNFIIFIKIITWDQTMVDNRSWLVTVHCQLKYLISVCVAVCAAELIRCRLCISIVCHILHVFFLHAWFALPFYHLVFYN